ncbi:MAG: hypothetical protein KAX31_06880, partial [Thermoplasmata archaeon]|nr:hypothetical protein [Thermoplasmata archaeon]
MSAMGGLIGVASNVQDRESGTQPALNAVTVLDSDRDLTVLTLRCSGLIEGSIIANDEVFTTLSFPGLDHIGSIGKPQLPYASAHVAVPNGLVTATVTNDEYYETSVGLVYPAQSPDPDLYVEEEPKFAFDQITYTTNAFYPNDVILLVEQGEVRGIPFSVVGFNPVQYNPVTGIARVHTRIDVDLTWDDSVPFRMEERLKSKSFMDFYENAFQNWESFEKTFSDELASESSTPKGPNGCEYLIIVDPAFVNAADTLATWKLERGIDTRVVDTTETGITQPEIAAYILDAYTNWTPAPSYVLLFGDADHINTNYVNVHPYHGTITGTDLWYYTLDGPDYFADMFFGRIPVDTAAQADNYINKIVDYEIDPPYNSGYYNNVTVAAYFQDPGLDGTEDRRFVRTSEEVRDYLMNNQTYDVERIYVTEASVTPTNYNDGNYWWPISGEPIPADLLRANGFPWDGGATEIKSRVDSGTFILNHRDHGSREGWGDPFFQIPEVGTLDNGDLLPIVYNINCMT